MEVTIKAVVLVGLLNLNIFLGLKLFREFVSSFVVEWVGGWKIVDEAVVLVVLLTLCAFLSQKLFREVVPSGFFVEKKVAIEVVVLVVLLKL